MVMAKVYMDYAAGATPNPSSIHSAGMAAKRDLEEARKVISGFLTCRPSEIVFTSGGTESNNLAIFGVAKKSSGRHIVTTNIEHASVLEPLRALERDGYEVTCVPVEENGIVDPVKIKRVIRDDTALVSVMYANNEIGTVHPIEEIAKIIRHRRKTSPVIFHVDACQAPGLLPINLGSIDGVSLASFSGQKFGGPRGVGFLFAKSAVDFAPLNYGGGQEYGRRAGTENVEGAVAMARALTVAEKYWDREVERLIKLRDYFILRLQTVISEVILNGDSVDRLANNVNVSFLGCDNEMIVISLDAKGVYVSPGSACMAHESDPSHVIKAITKDARRIAGAVRFSFGRGTKKSDLDYVVKILPEIIARERRLK